MRKQILKNLEGKPKIYPIPHTWTTPGIWLKKVIEEVRRVEEGKRE